ncbi:MAG TPA: glycosyltransferase [Trueperaceae bacterium]
MRVAYITMQFPVPSETFARNDVRRLTGRGVEIAVHTLLPGRRDALELLAQSGLSSLPIYANGPGPSLRGLGAALLRPRLLWRTLRWVWRDNRPSHALLTTAIIPRAFGILASLEEDRPDVVHIFWGHYPAVVGFLVRERLPGVPVSMALNAYDLTMRYGGSPEVARRASFLRTHARVNVADVASFTGVPEERVNVIYNGVDLEWLDGIAAGVEKVPGRLAVAGRLIESKGIDEVIRVFARVREEHADASLVVMGEGPARRELVRLAESLGVDHAVSFLGHVPHAWVVEELARAQVVLLLSRKDSERLPNAIKEGMACRSVCVATDTPGMDELIDHGRSGYIVRAGETEKTAEMVSSVLAGRVDVSAMVEEARRQIERNFDLRVTTESYLRAWGSLVGTVEGASEPVAAAGD